MNQSWAKHDSEWRDPAEVVSQWSEAGRTEPGLLAAIARGGWWDVLGERDITLLVTREYEHLVLAISPHRRTQTFLRVPHPSGLVVDRDRGVVHLASTRNPNQVFQLAPISNLVARTDVKGGAGDNLAEDKPLLPVGSIVLPGSTYIHDLAIVGSELHANAVGENCVIAIGQNGCTRRVWWPRSIETKEGPVFTRNHLQLNSIAAGRDMAHSFFTASTDRMATRRPAHRNFPVDRRGVVFSGESREVIARGLTRPHSARLHNGAVWLDNSGYGEVGVVNGERFEPHFRLPGWTRGLCFHDGVAFIGTSRVIPRFRQFAPGVDASRAVCAIYAVAVASGAVLGSLAWPAGNQVFAIDWMPSSMSRGLPFHAERRSASERILFYAFDRGLDER